MFGGNYTGYDLPFAPHVSGTAGYQHTWRLESNGGLTARLETHLETASWVTFNEMNGTHQPGHSVSNGYLTYDAANGKWSISGYVRNLENTAVLVNGQGGPVGVVTGDIAPTRTYGVQISARF